MPTQQIVKIYPLQSPDLYSTTSTDYAMTAAQQTLWDTSKLSGVIAAYFEVYCLISNSLGTVSVCMVDSAAPTTPITGTALTSSSTAAVLVRSADISANLTTGHEYEVRAKSSSTAYTARLATVRLVIILNGSLTAMESQIDMAGSAILTASTDWVDEGMYFTYDSTKYNGTVLIYFESTFRSGATADTASIRLVDVALNQIAILTSTSTVQDRQRSAAISLTNGTVYKVQIKNSNTATSMVLAGAKIIILQSASPTLTETYYNIKNQDYSGSLTTYSDTRGATLWDANEWNVTSYNAYYEAVIKSNTTVRATTAQLYYATSTEQITVTTTATTPTVVRSAAQTLSDDATYKSNFKTAATAATATIYGSWIIIQPTISQTSIKTINGLAKSSVKTFNGLAIASVKTINGLA